MPANGTSTDGCKAPSLGAPHHEKLCMHSVLRALGRQRRWRTVANTSAVAPCPTHPKKPLNPRLRAAAGAAWQLCCAEGPCCASSQRAG